MENIEKIEAGLWEAADDLRSNGNVPSNEYFMPVMGILFLRHAANRYKAAHDAIKADQAAGRVPKRKIVEADYKKRRALMLPEIARFEYLQNLPSGISVGKALVDAMEAVEAKVESLTGLLPKDYEKFDNDLLDNLLRVFDREEMRTATGDIFGRIYEYFLMKFSMSKAHDDGEFFTPPSIVQTLINVIEPDHGKILDPACGSGGMFVQSSHFIENQGQNTAHKVTFYGQEKTATTVRLAKMNLAVHGLEGDIRESNSYYEDAHELVGQCDFVMANPPFNVDMIDAEKIKTDIRLPFGLPGVNKSKKVSNGNYVWISYFHSYLKEASSAGSGRGGRAGFVMSSQASSAGNAEAEVRKKLVESGDMDAMIAIRSNFFYTRTVPCELWYFDKSKPSPPAPLPEGEGSFSSPLAPLPEGEGKHFRGGFDFAGLTKKARGLRQEQTPAEGLLWALLRNRQLGGAKFRRQHQYGDYICDFYCNDAKLVVECDGDVHNSKEQQAKDKKRDAYLRSQGLTVLRFKNERILKDTESVLQAIAQHTLNLPSPPGRGAGAEGGEAIGAGGEGRSCPPNALNHKGNVLMIDARKIYRKVTRKIYDFSPEQMRNLAAISWLYRGQTERFEALVSEYTENWRAARRKLDSSLPEAGTHCHEFISACKTAAINLPEDAKGKAEASDAAKALIAQLEPVNEWTQQLPELHAQRDHESAETRKQYPKDVAALHKQLQAYRREADAAYRALKPAIDKKERKAFEQSYRKAQEQVDAIDAGAKDAAYWCKQIEWLRSRFPDGVFADVPGLCKAVSLAEIEAADWSLTPGRYVGVAAEEEDDDFDFEATMKEIHGELSELDAEASTLAKKIQSNFKELV
jgi:type I restriction-modification system DNA methylase subunit/very-short-patch-repair endonuclease